MGAPSDMRSGPSILPMALVTLLLLLPATAWASSWFWVQTGAGQEHVQRSIKELLREGAVEAAAIGWGPGLLDFWLLDAELRGPDGSVAVRAEVLAVALDVQTTLHQGLTLRGVAVDGFELNLAWDAAGDLNLAAPLLRHPRPADEDEDEERGRPILTFDGIDLSGGRLTLSWPTWGLSFDDVHADGAVRVGVEVGLGIDAELRSARAIATVGDREVRFDRVHIDGFEWSGGGFAIESLRLERDDGSRVALGGRMGLSGGLELDARGALQLQATGVGSLIDPYIPDGATLEGLVLTVDRAGMLTAEVSAARAGRILAPDVKIEGLATSALDVSYGQGALVPRFGLHTRGARAAAVAVDGAFVGESLEVDRLDADLEGGARLTLEGLRGQALVIAGREVGAATLGGTLDAGMSGGELTATLGTAALGSATATGRISTSLLKRRAEVVLDIALEGVNGALAEAVIAALEPSDRPAHGPPLTGKLVAEITASAAPRGVVTKVTSVQLEPAP